MLPLKLPGNLARPMGGACGTLRNKDERNYPEPRFHAASYTTNRNVGNRQSSDGSQIPFRVIPLTKRYCVVAMASILNVGGSWWTVLIS